MQDLAPHLPIITAAAAVVTLLGVIGIFLSVRRLAAVEPFSRDALILVLRAENETLRRAAEEQARAGRQDMSDHIHRFGDSINNSVGILRESIDSQVRGFGGRLGDGLAAMKGDVESIRQKLDRDIAQMGDEAGRSREVLRETIEGRLAAAANAQSEQAKALRDEVGANVRGLGDRNAAALADMSVHQKERLENAERAIRELTQKNSAEQGALRESVEGRLDAIRGENAAKLEEMRRTVDEKLQSTLEARLGESFTRVVDQLNRVHEGLGEMKSLAANVGDLRSVLTNVKVRGTYGEVQLELILEQMLAPQQFVKNAQVKSNSLERVEFAIRLPGRNDSGEVLLPIDAKFPRETFERLLAASEVGDADAVIAYRKELEVKIRASAKTICEKYVLPPFTTDFAIMFLPTEGLYAEVLRQPGLFERLQREHKVVIAGPTTLSALLNALKMGFQTLAIERKSSEVWQVLGAVKTEFGNYNKAVELIASNLNKAVDSVEALGKKTKKVTRALDAAEKLTNLAAGEVLLRFDDLQEETSPFPGPSASPLPIALSKLNA